MTHHTTPTLNACEQATILAALRYYQQMGMGSEHCRSEDINRIATDGERLTALADEDIDALCERLNTGPTFGGPTTGNNKGLFMRAWNGKLVRVVGMFPVLGDDYNIHDEPANVFMAANPGTGLLAIVNDIALIACNDDEGTLPGELGELSQCMRATGWRAEGEANRYTLIRNRIAEAGTSSDDWLAAVQMNGELTTEQQAAIMERLAAAVAAPPVATGTTVHVAVELDADFIDSVLIGAVEQGYPWFDWTDIENTDDPKRAMSVLMSAATATEHDPDEGTPMEGAKPVRVDGPAIAAAIGRILSGEVKVGCASDIARAVAERDAGCIDVDMADCIMQVAVLGEIRYG